jgi:hypothetical protein
MARTSVSDRTRIGRTIVITTIPIPMDGATTSTTAPVPTGMTTAPARRQAIPPRITTTTTATIDMETETLALEVQEAQEEGLETGTETTRTTTGICLALIWARCRA